MFSSWFKITVILLLLTALLIEAKNKTRHRHKHKPKYHKYRHQGPVSHDAMIGDDSGTTEKPDDDNPDEDDTASPDEDADDEDTTSKPAVTTTTTATTSTTTTTTTTTPTTPTTTITTPEDTTTAHRRRRKKVTTETTAETTTEELTTTTPPPSISEYYTIEESSTVMPDGRIVIRRKKIKYQVKTFWVPDSDATDTTTQMSNNDAANAVKSVRKGKLRSESDDETFTGDATYTTPGQSACETNDHEGQLVAAINPEQFGQFARARDSPWCGQCVQVSATRFGKSVKVKVTDRAGAGKTGHIVLSKTAFSKLASPDEGRIDVTYKKVDSC